MTNATLYSNQKPTGSPGCPTCGGAGYMVYNVSHLHPDFGKAKKCECFRIPNSITNQEAGYRVANDHHETAGRGLS